MVAIIFSTKQNKPMHPPLFYGNDEIVTVSSHKHLDVTLSSNLSWRCHILDIHDRALKRLNLFKRLKFKLTGIHWQSFISL